MVEEIVIKVKPPVGWPCPNCHGLGHMCDGWISAGETEVRIKPGTPCFVCRGNGRVRVEPIIEGTAS